MCICKDFINDFCVITSISCIYVYIHGICLIDFTLCLLGLVIQYTWVFMLISCMINVFEYNCDIIKQHEDQNVYRTEYKIFFYRKYPKKKVANRNGSIVF